MFLHRNTSQQICYLVTTPVIDLVVALITLHNYIKRKSQKDIVFNEYDRHSNFVLQDILLNVVPNYQTQSSHRPSRMDYICDDIATNLMDE